MRRGLRHSGVLIGKPLQKRDLECDRKGSIGEDGQGVKAKEMP
jgi:hypothetical protein